jgi:hypothetical protein
LLGFPIWMFFLNDPLSDPDLGVDGDATDHLAFEDILCQSIVPRKTADYQKVEHMPSHVAAELSTFSGSARSPYAIRSF